MVDVSYSDFPDQSQDYGNARYQQNLPEKPVVEQIRKLAIADDVKDKAESIYFQIQQSTSRSHSQSKLIVYVVYCAFREMNMVRDPLYVCNLLKIKPADLSKSYSLFSQIQTNYKPPCIKVHPTQLIPLYCETLDIVSTEIVKLCHRICAKDPSFEEYFPQLMAVACIGYYSNYSGFSIHSNILAGLIGRSATMVNSLIKLITVTDNT